MVASLQNDKKTEFKIKAVTGNSLFLQSSNSTVMYLTTFQGSNYVEETVNLEALTSLWVPDWLVEDYLNFSCYAPEESLAAIRAAAGG